MTKSIFLTFVVLFLLSDLSFAQTEKCNDGIDNDNDGLVDCNDPDCQAAATEELRCNCFDNIDNDGDSLIDFDDPDCANDYGLEFVQDTPDCSIPPPPGTSFFTVDDAPIESQQNTVDTQSKLVVGDVNNDGIPDVVVTSKKGRNIRVLATTDNQADGTDAGDIKQDYNTPGDNVNFPSGNWYMESEVAIADINGDGFSEIFAFASKRPANGDSGTDEFRLVGYTYNQNPGANELEVMFSVSIGATHPGVLGVADFDSDGLAEVYFKNRIYAAESGVLLADGGGDWITEVNSAPVAANVLGSSPNLELIAGRFIYTVPNLSSRTIQPITVAADMNSLGANYFPKVIDGLLLPEYGPLNFSSTSVADFDADGFADVFVSGATSSNVGPTTVFYWNLQKNFVTTFFVPHPDVVTPGAKKNDPPVVETFPNGWKWGTGRINLGDIDGDDNGLLEATFISGSQLWAIEEAAGTLVEKWANPAPLKDSRSGILSITTYDFDNNGVREVVYRDSQELGILDGATGLLTAPANTCFSHTLTEGPIIADMNGDGDTDICVPCYTNETSGFDIDDAPISEQALGQINLYNSSEGAWIPCRRVWNQPGYFIVNINDDLTLPRPQFDQSMVFSQTPCGNGATGPVRPFNNFMNQIPSIAANGCPVYPAPDIAFVGDDPTLQPGDPGYVDPSDPNYFPAVEVIPPTCGDLGITVNFNIINNGSRSITATVPVSYWDGDPTVDPAAVRLHKNDIVLADFQIGDTLSLTGITFNMLDGSAFDLYIVLGDNGDGGLPVVIDQSTECRIDNNIYRFPITPDPFTIQVDKLSDNEKCDPSEPDNGEALVRIFEGGVEVAPGTKYSIQWYSGPDAQPGNEIANPGSQPELFQGLADGDYSAIVTNTLLGCNSIPAFNTINLLQPVPNLAIQIVSHQTKCTPDEDGELSATVDPGYTVSTYRWTDKLGTTTFATTQTASGLAAGEYVVEVTLDGGCTFQATETIDGPVVPTAFASVLSNVTSCVSPNGSVEAQAIIGGVVQDPSLFEFRWYFFDDVLGALGSPLPVTNYQNDVLYAPIADRLNQGWYAVVVRDQNNCESSPPFPIFVDSNQLFPELTISEVAPQTSCDPNTPNGQFQVDIAINGVPQSPALFTIEWFRGDNTLPANLLTTTAGTNGEIGQGIAAGGLQYTARVTSAEGCFSTALGTVSETLTNPIASERLVIPNATCDPSLATSNFSGRIETDILYNGAPISDFTDFVFTWFDGANPATDPVFTTIAGADGSILTDLEGGRFYTLIVGKQTESCNSNALAVFVPNAPIFPDVVITEVPETTCPGAATPNGTLSAAVNVGGTPVVAGYTYEWFVGTDTSPTGTNVSVIAGAQGETALELEGNQQYTVVVTNTLTGCVTEQTYTLSDQSNPPVVTLSVVPNGICDVTIGYNGQVIATLSDPNGAALGHDINNPADYRVDWYTGQAAIPANQVVDPDLSTPLVLEGRNENDYAVVITNLRLSCTSTLVYEFLPDQLPTIDIVITETPETTCPGAATPNGQLSATANGATAGFEFDWYLGTDPTNPATQIVNNNPSAVNLDGSLTYTVVAREVTSGCEETESFNLRDLNNPPVVALSTTPNGICDPTIGFNGTVVAVLTDPNGTALGHDINNPLDYQVEWYSGQAVVPANLIADPDPSTPLVLEQRDENYYSVVVTNLILGCSSTLVYDFVQDQTPAITITVTPTPETTCPGAATPNGELLASGASAGNTLGYDYEWFLGTDVSGSGTSLGTAASVTQLEGNQQYTIVVRDRDTGCTEQQTVTLPDLSNEPVVSLVTTPNSICDPLIGYNGTAVATLTDPNGTALGHDINNPLDYQVEWYSGQAAVPANLIADPDPSTPLILEGRNENYYSVVITNLRLSCSSTLVYEFLQDQTPAITITVTPTPETTCPGAATPNGELLASGASAGNVSGYDYEWFLGTDTSGSGTSLGATASVTQLEGSQQYTVVVRDRDTGCLELQTVTLQDLSSRPVVTLTGTNNTICDPNIDGPGGIEYDGQITATFTDPNGAALGLDINNPAHYQVTWYTGLGAVPGNEVIDPDPLTPLILENRNGGDFTIVIDNLILGCSSQPEFETIIDDPFPIFLTFTNNPNTSCVVPANGDLSVDIFIDSNRNGIIDEPAENSNNYNIVWTDASAGTPTAGATNNSIIELDGNQFYTANIESQLTGCTISGQNFVPRNIVIPIVNANVTVPFADCTTNPEITATITNLADFPVGTTVADFTFQWFRVAEELASDEELVHETGDVLTTIDGAARLAADDYYVIATHPTSGCISNTANATITEPPPVIMFDPELITIPTTCNAIGEISVTVTTPSAGNVTFEWFDGTPTNTAPQRYFTYDASLAVQDFVEAAPPNVPTATLYTIPVIQFNAPSFRTSGPGTTDNVNNITDGVYTLLVTDQDTGCQEYITINVPFDNAQEDQVVITRPDFVCDVSSPNGEISIDIVPSGFDVFRDTESDYLIYLFSSINPDLTAPMPNFGSPVYNGVTGVVGDDIGSNVFTNLAPGNYSVVSIPGDAAAPQRCWSIPTTVTVQDWGYPPILTPVGSVSVNQNCDDANFNGSIDLLLEHHPNEMWDPPAIPEPTYTLTINAASLPPNILVNGVPYAGPGFAIPALNPVTRSINLNIAGLGGDIDYTFIIDSDRLACTENETYLIPDEIDAPELKIDLISINPDLTCLVPVNGVNDGGVVVNNVQVNRPDGTFYLDDPANYEFQWHQNSYTAGAPDYIDGNATFDFNDFSAGTGYVGSGTYYLVVRKLVATNPLTEFGIGCVSNPIEIIVPDQSVPPTYDFTVTASSSCDPATGDGTITITADDSASPVNGPDWTYTWISTPAGAPLASPVTISTLTPPAFTDLPAGLYTLELTYDATGCTVTRNIDIPSNPINPEIQTSPGDITPQITCSITGTPNDGSITVFDIFINGGSVPFNQFNFDWYIGDDFPTAQAGGIQFSGVGGTGVEIYDSADPNFSGAGTYWLVATRIAGVGLAGSNCESAPIKYVIPQESVDPDLTYAVTENTVCDLANPNAVNASITVTAVDTDFQVPIQNGNWNFIWITTPYDDPADPTDNTEPARPAGALGPDNDLSDRLNTSTKAQNYTFLLPGDYRIRLESVANGCFYEQDINVPSNPVYPEIQTTAADIDPLIVCTPVGGGNVFDGQISVSAININGAPVALTEFDFEWRFGADFNTAPVVWNEDGAAATQPFIINSDPVKLAYSGAGTYWLVVTRKSGNNLPGEGCPSPPMKYVIETDTQDPALSYSVTENTVCDISNPNAVNGAIQVTADDSGLNPLLQGGNWDFVWVSSPYDDPLDPTDNTEPARPNGALGPDNDLSDRLNTPLATQNYTLLIPGNYRIRLTSVSNGCFYEQDIIIPDNPIYPQIITTPADIDPLIVCTPVGGGNVFDGQITVGSININGAPVPFAEFDFEWRFGPDFNTAPVVWNEDGAAATQPFIINSDPIKLAYSGAGTYWLVVTRKPGNNLAGEGCPSPPMKYVIETETQDPALSYTVMENTVCDINNPNAVNGAIQVIADDSGLNPLLQGGNWDFVWIDTPYDDPANPGDDSEPARPNGGLGPDNDLSDRLNTAAATQNYTELVPGNYRIQITSLTNGCTFEQDIFIPDNPIYPQITTAPGDVDPQLVCTPIGGGDVRDGRITVSGIEIDGVPTNVNEFFFEWYIGPDFNTAFGSGTTLTGQGGTGVEVYDSSQPGFVGVGTYWLVVTRIVGNNVAGLGCPSPPVSYQITDQHTDPFVDFTITNNSSCDPTSGNGQIIANAREIDGTDTDTYSFVWTYNGTPGLPASANITSTSNNSITVDNLPEGDYSVVVTNTTGTNCSSTFGTTLIIDQTNSIPNIIDAIATNPTDCNSSGAMEVTRVQVAQMDRPIGDFEFEWYAGSLAPANILRDASNNPINTPQVNGVGPGTYYVIARELNTLCESIAKGIIVSDVDIIAPRLQVTLDNPQTSCDPLQPNGALTAVVVDDNPAFPNPTYQFTWFQGSDTSGPQIGTGATISGLFDGIYTVEVVNPLSGCSSTSFYVIENKIEEFLPRVTLNTTAVDECFQDNGSIEAVIRNVTGTFVYDWTLPDGSQITGGPAKLDNIQPGTYSVVAREIAFSFCESPLAQRDIADERVYPTPSIEVTQPLINCDPARANGVMIASVDNSIVGFDFLWFDGTAVSNDTTNIGHIYSGIGLGDYTVLVTDQLTGCQGTDTQSLTDGRFFPPSPDGEVLSDLTNCINPNGAVAASVDGNITDYTFSWYDGNSVSGSPAGSEFDYFDLLDGDYTVTAADKVTGCVSEPLTLNVKDLRVIPQFDFLVKAANCEESNGFAELQFDQTYSLKDVAWTDDFGNFVGQSVTLFNQPAGTYFVEVTTFEECTNDGTVDIPVDITDYNGISANNDGQNDDWQIDCITLFPNNNVKIFNRAGVLVYEADDYDNDQTVFTGKGENGVYLMGEDLPDGTYFYIIDKRDGSRPLTGYLELIR